MNFNFFGRPQSPRTISGPKFDAGVRTILALATAESQRLGHEYIGTEHLALAFTRADSPGIALLQSLHVDVEVLRRNIERECKRATAHVEVVPYTSRSKKVLELAMHEATVANSGGNEFEVTVECLLKGIIAEGKGVGAQKLIEAGLSSEAASIAMMLKSPATPQFKVQLSEVSDLSITEQIVAQVAEGIATGLLRQQQRLPPVRRLAEELDVATGTVARAYTELEMRGLVVTDGARGTTVARHDPKVSGMQDRIGALTLLLRPAAVQAFHLGATLGEMREALDRAVRGVKLGADEDQGH